MIAIEAALARRAASGEGAYIDMALMDAQVAVLANQALNYLVSGARRAVSATPIPISCRTRCSKSRTAISSSRPAMIASCRPLRRPGRAGSPTIRDFSPTTRRRTASTSSGGFRTDGQIPRATLLETLEGVAFPPARSTIAQVFADPQVIPRGLRIDRPARRGGRITSRRAYADRDRRRGDGGSERGAAARRTHGRDFARDRRGLSSFGKCSFRNQGA